MVPFKTNSNFKIVFGGILTKDRIAGFKKMYTILAASWDLNSLEMQVLLLDVILCYKKVSMFTIYMTIMQLPVNIP